MPFGFDFDSHGHLVLTEAGPSAVATFDVSPDGRLTARDLSATAQAATCWLVADGDSVYASNAGSASLSTYRVGGAGELSGLGNTATGAGTVDATVSSDGQYLYVQAGATGEVDSFRIGSDGSLSATGSVTVPNAEALPAWSPPPFTVMVPVRVLVPDNDQTVAPLLARLAAPDMTPEKLLVPA